MYVYYDETKRNELCTSTSAFYTFKHCAGINKINTSLYITVQQ